MSEQFYAAGWAEAQKDINDMEPICVDTLQEEFFLLTELNAALSPYKLRAIIPHIDGWLTELEWEKSEDFLWFTTYKNLRLAITWAEDNTYVPRIGHFRGEECGTFVDAERSIILEADAIVGMLEQEKGD